MASITADKNIVRFGRMNNDSPHRVGVKGTSTLYAGALCMRDAAGYAVTATAAASLVTIGIARYGYSGGGVDGSVQGEFDNGDYLLDNDGTNPVTIAHRGTDCYVVDDHTVSSSATGTSRAGKVVDVNPPGYTGVVVRVGLGY